MTNCLSPSMIPGHLHSLWAHFSRQTTCTPQVFLPPQADTSHGLKDPFYRQLCFVQPHGHPAAPPQLQISYFRPPSRLPSSFQYFKWAGFSQDAGQFSWLPESLPREHLPAQLQSNQQIFPALLTPDPLLPSSQTPLVWMLLPLGKNYKHSSQRDLQART